MKFKDSSINIPSCHNRTLNGSGGGSGSGSGSGSGMKNTDAHEEEHE